MNNKDINSTTCAALPAKIASNFNDKETFWALMFKNRTIIKIACFERNCLLFLGSL